MDFIKRLYENESEAVAEIGKRAYNILQMQHLWLEKVDGYIAIHHYHYSGWNKHEIQSAKRIAKYIFKHWKKYIYIGDVCVAKDGKLNLNF